MSLDTRSLLKTDLCSNICYPLQDSKTHLAFLQAIWANLFIFIPQDFLVNLLFNIITKQISANTKISIMIDLFRKLKKKAADPTKSQLQKLSLEKGEPSDNEIVSSFS